MNKPSEVVEDLLREFAPQVLATLVRRHGDFADAEDAVQEALLAAALQWPAEGTPANPRGWLATVASRRLADAWRSDAARHNRETLAATKEPSAPADVSDVDDSLLLLFLCCHPALPASSGRDVARKDLSAEAIRLARMLHAALPVQAEVAGLLALMLLTDARRPARTGPHGELVPLAEQDRRLWDRDLIAEGVALISATLPRRQVGYYQLQAAIAAIHDEAETAGATDWPQILALYGLLARISTNPMVTLNRAIAAAMVHGPATGLAMLESLDKQLAGNHRLTAVRAHLLEMTGDVDAAIAHYRVAASRTTSEAERQYLTALALRLGQKNAQHPCPN